MPGSAAVAPLICRVSNLHNDPRLFFQQNVWNGFRLASWPRVAFVLAVHSGQFFRDDKQTLEFDNCMHAAYELLSSCHRRHNL